MISVIIPSYKPGEYIRKCLDSLNHQTLPTSQFEVIIVLNGCDEPYRGMLQGVITSYRSLNIRLLQTDQGGVSNARNMGLDAAKGDYISFLDDDDWVSSSYLQLLLMHISSESIVVSNVIDYDEESMQQKSGYINRAYLRLKDKGPLSLIAGRSFMSSSCCKMIPRDLIGEKRFNVNFRLGEDALFMASISQKIKAIILANDDAIYYRRLRIASSSDKGDSRLEKSKYAVRLAKQYICLYISDIRHNNLVFFSSRILASLMKIFKTKWI